LDSLAAQRAKLDSPWMAQSDSAIAGERKALGKALLKKKIIPNAFSNYE
jgi:hypothetical protein